MKAEQGEEWLPGITLIVNALTPPFDDDERLQSALQYVQATYKSMLGGSGSFSDFYVWRDDFDERVKENTRLDQIKSEIWDTLEA